MSDGEKQANVPTNERELSSSAKKAIRKREQKPRITKLELGMILAVWAEHKPDSAAQRESLSKLAAQKAEGEAIEDKRMAEVITGATLMDSTLKIISVAGSGYTHASAYLCSLFPTQARGGVICVTKKPCSHCLKMMTQAGVGRIVVLSPAKSEDEPFYRENEPSQIKQEKAPMKKEDFEKLMLSSTTAMSTFHFHTVEDDLSPSDVCDLLLKSFRKSKVEDKLNDWHTGLAILASLRSEDTTLKVGAVLAKITEHKDGNSTSIIHSVGYNGFRQQALHFDYDEKEKAPFSLHAEQNLLLFRGAHDISECTLFTTHNPCYQCSCLILQHDIRSIYFTDYYRAPCLISWAKRCKFGLSVVRQLNPEFTKDNAPPSNTPQEEIIIAIQHYKDYTKSDKDNQAITDNDLIEPKNLELVEGLVSFLLSPNNQEEYDWNELAIGVKTLLQRHEHESVPKILTLFRDKAKAQNNKEAENSFQRLLDSDK